MKEPESGIIKYIDQQVLNRSIMKTKFILFLFVILFTPIICKAQSGQNDLKIKWDINPLPVFTDPDDNFAKDPAVLKTTDKFYMFYTGSAPGAQGQNLFSTWQIEYATSPDGLNWTKQGVSFKADSSTWEAGRVQAPSRPVWYKGKYYMFYTGGPRKPKNLIYTGFATSTDLIHWTKNPKIIKQNVERANDIAIYKENDTFYMFYTTYTENAEPVLYRTSTDLENWTEPVETGASGEGPSVWKEGGIYYMVACLGYSGKGEFYKLYSSTKLTGFKDLGKAFDSVPSWASDSNGHGDVIISGDERLFYFQGTHDLGKTFQIGLARAKGVFTTPDVSNH
jgi:predicted GH43/DUF377 family glycosyl hydrolase